jgi:hypothetical protein
MISSIKFLLFVLILVAVKAVSANVVIWSFDKDNLEAESSDEKREIYISSYSQFRFEYIQDDDNNPNDMSQFNMNSAHLILGGKLHKWFDFKFDFNADPRTPKLLEYYGDIVGFRYMKVRFGQFKVPIRHQILVPGHQLLFADYAMVNSKKTGDVFIGSEKDFPGRDLGFMVYGDLFPIVETGWNLPEGMLRYYFSMTTGQGTSLRGVDQEFMYTVRGEINPTGHHGWFESGRFDRKKFKSTLGFNFSTKKEGLENNLKKMTFIGADAAIAFYGFAMSGGWYQSVTELPKFKDENGKTPSSKLHGWYFQFSGFPPFWVFEDHLELMFRIQQFDPNDEAPPMSIDERMSRVISYGLGVYLFEDNFKISWQYNHSLELEDYVTSDPAQGKKQIKNDNWILQTQIYF